MPIRVRRPTTRSLEDILRLVSDEPAREPSALPSDPAAPGQGPQPAVDPEAPFLSLREAAEWLGVSMSTLNRLLHTGTLSAVRIGARRKVPANYLAAYLARDIITPSQAIDLAYSLIAYPEHIQNTAE